MLAGLTYLDKGKDPKNPETKTEDREAITFNAYMDRYGAGGNIQHMWWTDPSVAQTRGLHRFAAMCPNLCCARNAQVRTPERSGHLIV